MICLRVLFIVTLAVTGLDYVRAKIWWKSPVSFNYMHGDKLDIDITLQNVPPVAKHYVLYYQTENCDANIRGSQCYGTAKTGPVPSDGPIHITQNLNRGSITLDIEIRSSNKICSTKRIMDGLKDANADTVEGEFRACLNNYNSLCEIIIDFRDTCKDKINCTITESRGLLTCESPDVGLPDATVHQWYQCYSEGTKQNGVFCREVSLIGAIPPVKGNKTKFEMRYHQFDLNTYIHSKMSSTHWKTDLNTEIFQIPLSTNGYKKYDVKSNITYSESEQVHFTCSNKAHTQVGWIDPTGHTITTYNVTSYSWTFNKEHNSSMWCCINYITYINVHETTVERSVDDITILIYKEPGRVIQNDDKANTKDNKSEDASQTLETSSSPEPEAPQRTTLAETPQDQQRTEPSDKTKYYIGIASVAWIIILISLIYVVIKKCYRKSYDPQQTLQLETYASTNAVLYAELDIRPGNAPLPPSTDDPTYAEIIGVLRPQNQNVKKLISK